MSGSAPVLLRRRLDLPGDDVDANDDTALSFQSKCEVDGISSLVALTLEHHIPLLADGFTANPSAITVRAGSGGFATVNVSRLSKDLSGRQYSWFGEVNRFFRSERPAGRKLAVKLTANSEKERSTMAWPSLAREIRILGHESLRKHPNIVDIIALGWTGTIYDDLATNFRWPTLLMEYADCGTLEDFFTLEGIDFSWHLKIGVSYDIIQGLEALDDSGVVHGDLKLANILVFRTGVDSFTAKLCDFGSAMIPIDLAEDEPIRQTTFTPPWNAPESSQDIEPDDLYKIDIYGYGLLLCGIFLEGGNLFQIELQSMQITSQVAIESIIRKWKEDDNVSDVCKETLRQFSRERYTPEQLRMLDNILDITVRTNIESRADEHFQIKSILRPDLASEESQNRLNFTWETIESETLPPLFFGDITQSVPNTERCWESLLPPNIAAEITEDLQRVASIKVTKLGSSDAHDRVAAAAYQLSQCRIQGFGCDVSYDRAGQLLIQSAELGNRLAHNDLFRIFGALEMPIPTSIEHRLCEWTVANAISGSALAIEDLHNIDPSLVGPTKHKLRTTYSPLGKDIFGDSIRNFYDLHNPSDFVNQITHLNDEIPFEDEDGGGLTWLHYAASNGSIMAVQLLIQQPNCDIDCCTATNWTPLWIACAAGHSDVVKVLLEKGADARIKSDVGRTCLHYLQAFEPDVVEEIACRLVGSGADIEATDINMETPLCSACLMKMGKEAIPAVQALIQLGANPTTVSSKGYTCIDLAAMNLDPNLLRALLKSCLFNGERGTTASVAVRAKALNKLCKIPKYHRFRHGGALRQSKTEEVLQLLLSDDVLAAYIDDLPNSYAPLHDACIWGCSDLIEPLLSFASIDINRFTELRGKEAETVLPLFEALKLNHVEIVKTLIRHGANMTLSDSANRNVLHFAVEFAPELLEFFLECLRQLDCDIQNFINAGTKQHGFTPFDMAVRCERFNLADTLLKAGAQYNELTRLGEAGERYNSLGSTGGSRRQMSYFLDMPKDLRPDLIVCSNGFTLFHITAASFDNALLEADPSPADNIIFLLEHYSNESDANQGDNEASTPLHVAALFGNTSVAQTLLDTAGAEVNARNKFGRTPLDLLEKRKVSMMPKMKETHLVDDLERRNWHHRNERMEKLLKRYGAIAGAQLG